MLTQLACIDDSLSFASAFEEQSCLFDWMHPAEISQMDVKSDTSAAFGCGEPIATVHEMLQANGQCTSSHIRSCSQLSAVSTASENSVPNFVYQRKRLLKSPAPIPWTPVPANKSLDDINFVYERRKHRQSSATNFPTVIPEHTPSNGACTSSVRSQNPSAASVERKDCSREMGATTTWVPSTSAVVSNNFLPLTTSETVDGCLIGVSGSDVKEKMNKTIELHSVDDSCSSSVLDVVIGSSPLKTEADDTDECSSSGVLVTDVPGGGGDISLLTKDLCISILRSHGRLSGLGPNGSGGSEEDAPSCSGSSFSRSCNICSLSGTAEDMLICDECEEAFHLSCCNPTYRKMPVDDWYCQSCFKKKHMMIKEKAFRKSSIIRSEKGTVTPEGDLSPVALMLRESEPYATGVRVGKGFQAIVPEWSGPITEDPDIFPEPVELDPSSLPEFISGKPRKSNYIGNWVQCREVIIGMGEHIDGTICGKWRRAPLFEVQTENWDCFRSVLWDPTSADCAVPQELETEEVLKQLKYIEMLRPRLEAKRRRLEMCRADGSQVHTEDASNCTASTNAARNS